jgi:hypothetical protein
MLNVLALSSAEILQCQPGAGPGFVVRGAGSRGGVWEPFNVPGRGPRGAKPSPPPTHKFWGFEELQIFNIPIVPRYLTNSYDRVSLL